MVLGPGKLNLISGSAGARLALPAAPARRVGAPARARAERGLGVGIEEAAIGVVESFELHPRDLLADEVLDGGDFLEILRGHDRERVADALGAPGAADAMHVVL